MKYLRKQEGCNRGKRGEKRKGKEIRER